MPITDYYTVTDDHMYNNDLYNSNEIQHSNELQNNNIYMIFPYYHEKPKKIYRYDLKLNVDGLSSVYLYKYIKPVIIDN